MGKSQRTKGHNGERWTVRQMRRLYDDARRNLDDVHGKSGTDVFAGPFAMQCKWWKSYAPINKLFEIQDDGIPVLVAKADRKPVTVTMLFDDWIAILEDIGVAYE